MKGILILFFSALSFCCYPQSSFEIFNLDKQEARLALDLYGLTNSLGNDPKINRINAIDSFARERVLYFLEVLQESHNGLGFNFLVNSIPKGGKAHQRLFGKPEIFKEPNNSVYPQNLPFLPSVGIKVIAEIMQQSTYSLVSLKEISNAEAVRKALIKFQMDIGEDFMLKSYCLSPDHNSIIQRFSKRAKGISAKAISVKTWVHEIKRWKYEIVIYNVVLFANSPIISG